MEKKIYKDYIILKFEKFLPEINRISIKSLIKDFLREFNAGKISDAHFDERKNHFSIYIENTAQNETRLQSEIQYTYRMLVQLFDERFLKDSKFKEIRLYHKSKIIILS